MICASYCNQVTEAAVSVPLDPRYKCPIRLQVCPSPTTSSRSLSLCAPSSVPPVVCQPTTSWQYIHMITERKEKLLPFHVKPGQIPDAGGFSFLGKTKQRIKLCQSRCRKFPIFCLLSARLQTTSPGHTKKTLNEYLRSLKCSISTNY